MSYISEQMDNWDGPQWLAFVWMVLFTPFNIVVAVWYYMRSHIQPIKARSPALVLLTNVIFQVWMVATCAQRLFVDDYPCVLNMWMGYFGVFCVANVFVIRCWILYSNFNTVRKISKVELDDEERVKFLEKARKRKSLGSLSKWLILAAVIVLPTPAYVTISDSEFVKAVGDGCPNDLPYIVLAIITAIYALIFIYFALIMRGVFDGFQIKAELGAIGLVGLVVLACWFIFNTVFPSVNDTFPVSTFALLIGILFVFLRSNCWCIYETYKNRIGNVNEQFDDDIDGFEKLLVENLLFWRAVESLKNYPHQYKGAADLGQKISSRANKIFKKYLMEDAVLEIEVSDEVRERTRENLKAGCSAIDFNNASLDAHFKTTIAFDEPQKLMFEWLKEAYERFLESEEYAQLLIELAMAVQQKELFTEFNMI